MKHYNRTIRTLFPNVVDQWLLHDPDKKAHVQYVCFTSQVKDGHYALVDRLQHLTEVGFGWAATSRTVSRKLKLWTSLVSLRSVWKVEVTIVYAEDNRGH